jgi:hypothetical protein
MANSSTSTSSTSPGPRAADEHRAADRVDAGEVERREVRGGRVRSELAAGGVDDVELDAGAVVDLERRFEVAVPDVVVLVLVDRVRARTDAHGGSFLGRRRTSAPHEAGSERIMPRAHTAADGAVARFGREAAHEVAQRTHANGTNACASPKVEATPNAPDRPAALVGEAAAEGLDRHPVVVRKQPASSSPEMPSAASPAPGLQKQPVRSEMRAAFAARSTSRWSIRAPVGVVQVEGDRGAARRSVSSSGP